VDFGVNTELAVAFDVSAIISNSARTRASLGTLPDDPEECWHWQSVRTVIREAADRIMASRQHKGQQKRQMQRGSSRARQFCLTVISVFIKRL